MKKFLDADLLLVDEWRAQLATQRMGFDITGILGVLIEAKRLGYIPALRPLLETPVANNIRISESLFNDMIRLDDNEQCA